MEKNKIADKKFPLGWLKTKIEEISYKVTDGTHFTPKYTTDGIPFISVKDIYGGKIHFDKCRYIPIETHADLVKRCHPQRNDLLITKSGTIGRLAIVDTDKDFSLFVSVALIKCPWGLVKSQYLKFFFEHYINSISISQTIKGGMLKNYHIEDIKKTEILLPPLAEQHRIVAKIEELFSDLDAGIESLKKARAQLKVYRQAVLKYAFEGKLTEEWRRQNAHNLEPAGHLLDRIKQERKKHCNTQYEEYEKNLKEWETNGKKGTKPSKPSKPKELPPLTDAELKELPVLPDGWAWVRLGNISLEIFDGPFGSNLKTDDYVDKGVRVIRLENIGNLKFINSKQSFITEQKYQTLEKHTVVAGDLIFSSFISDYTKVVLLPNYIDKAVNKADCFCVRLLDILSKRYIEFFLSTSKTHKQLSNKVHGATRPRINTTQLKQIVLPISSIKEQQQIVSEIEGRLSVCDKLEQMIEENLKKADALRQSILKKAFEGKLVPQNPNDEPAQLLLERIKAEKEKNKNP